jgi:uncharacterized protein (TIGR03435 family)
MVKTLVSLALLIGCAFGQPPAFEVATIKLSVDATRRPSLGPAPGNQRFVVKNMPLVWLISSAYDVSTRQVSGLPSEFESKSYDIEARTARPATRAQMMKMLQVLIEDRFKLRLRRETKELNVYLLAVTKGGAKLAENKDGADLEARNSGAGRESYRNFPMAIFANIMAAHVGDIVVDKTGLTESYDFKLEFTPERVGDGSKDGHEPPPNLEGPSLFTALKEQLGLELKRATVAVELFVIDHIEAPTGN